MENGKPARFSEITDRWDDVAQWFEVDDLLDQDILVTDAKEVKGQYGDYLLVKFRLGSAEVNYAFTTGAVVLMKKIMAAKEKGYLPLTGKIVKSKRYYDIV